MTFFECEVTGKMRGLILILTLFLPFFPFAQAIEIPKIGSKEFPDSAAAYFKMSHIFFGKISKVLYVDELQLRDYKVEVTISGKVYRGNPPQTLKMTLAGTAPEPKVGQEYMFHVYQHGEKFNSVTFCLLGSDNCEKHQKRYDYVTANGISSDEVLLDRFKEYQKMQAEEWRKNCEKKESARLRKACLKTTDDVLRL